MSKYLHTVLLSYDEVLWIESLYCLIWEMPLMMITICCSCWAARIHISYKCISI